MNTPEIGAFYYHYKHTDESVNNYAYEVIGIAHHTEIEGLDESAMVVYRPLYERVDDNGGKRECHVRPFSMFVEMVTKDSKTFPRFLKITDEKIILELEKIRDLMYK